MSSEEGGINAFPKWAREEVGTIYPGIGKEVVRGAMNDISSRSDVDKQTLVDIINLAEVALDRGMMLNQMDKVLEGLKIDKESEVYGLYKEVWGGLHFGIVRQIVRQLPERKGIVHRGSFKLVKDSIERVFPGVSSWLGEEKKRTSGLRAVPGLVLGMLIKESKFDLTEAQENLKKGIGGFEFDLGVNDMGELVVSHPPLWVNLLSFLGKKPMVKSLETTPKFTDVLDMVGGLLLLPNREARHGVKLVVDVKTGNNPEALERALVEVEKRGLLGRAFFQVYSPDVIEILDEIQDKLSGPKSGRGKYIFMLTPMGGPSNEVMKILERPENSGSRVGVPAAMFSEKFLNEFIQKHPKVGIHVNLVENEDTISRMLKMYQQSDGIRTGVGSYMTSTRSGAGGK